MYCNAPSISPYVISTNFTKITTTTTTFKLLDRDARGEKGPTTVQISDTDVEERPLMQPARYAVFLIQ